MLVRSLGMFVVTSMVALVIIVVVVAGVVVVFMVVVQVVVAMVVVVLVVMITSMGVIVVIASMLVPMVASMIMPVLAYMVMMIMSVVASMVVLTSMMMSMLCVLPLGILLILATSHLGLLEQSLLLGLALPLMTVLDLILPDQRFRRTAKDAFVLAKLADPDVIQARRVVEICVLLLDSALTCGQGVDLSWRTLLLAGCGLGLGWLVRLWHGTGLSGLRSLRGNTIRGERRSGRALLSGIGPSLQCHAFRGVGLAREGELGFGGRGVFFLEQAHVISTLGGRESRSVSDSRRDDSLI